MRRFMIADDSAVICKVAKRILTGLDYLVIEASNAGEAMIMCDAQLPDILCVRIFYLMIEKEFAQHVAKPAPDGFDA
jgi:CheY-like chemotaxis protein